MHEATFFVESILSVRFSDDTIVRVEPNDFGLVSEGLLGVDLGKGHHNEAVADLSHVGGGAIEAGDTGTAGPGDGIRLKALPIVEIGHQNLLVGDDANGIHEILINRQGAKVFKIRLRDAEVVEFGVEKCKRHNLNERTGMDEPAEGLRVGVST